MAEQSQVNRLFFDTEALATKKDEWSWDQYRTVAGISIACTIDMVGLPAFYTVTDSAPYHILDFADMLEEADELVSYNGISYDIPVLATAVDRAIKVRQHVDLYAQIRQALGGTRWPKGSWTLDRVARDTLNVGKSASGAFAPMLWRERRLGELATYVHRDVWLTRALWMHIREKGWVLDPDRHQLGVYVPH